MESLFLVPAAAELDEFVALAERGVKIKVLTNSLQATDVPIVHAGYAKRRKPLLEAGVTLYELRRLLPDTAPRKSAGPLGSSGSSLHAKAFSVDNSRVFIGSFKFYAPLSTPNTKRRFLIEPPSVSPCTGRAFDNRFLEGDVDVRISGTGQVVLCVPPAREY